MYDLHDHTEYSNIRLVDCINKVRDLIYRAVELGRKGVAITDHESVSGHVDAIKIVKSGKEEGKIPQDFKLILGNEIYLVDSLEEVRDNYISGQTKFWHFILLAKDAEGHRQLRELSSLAWDNSFYTGKMERVPTLKADLSRVVERNPGHLIASTACLGGELQSSILKEDWNRVNSFLAYCYDLFGSDFYLEMQPSDSHDQEVVNKTIINISQQCNLPYIVTCDAHYLKEEDRVFHEAFLRSHEEEREVNDFYKTTYMMTEEEIHKYLDSQIGKECTDKAIQNTDYIGSCIEEYDLAHPTIVPEAEIPEFNVNHIFEYYYDKYPYIKMYAYSEDKFDRYLLYLIENGFQEKKQSINVSGEEFHKRLSRIEIELSEMWRVTEKIHTSISSYYISTLELIDIMWNEGDSLVGIARGSVTGMYTMYLIGLIQMNPLDWGLPHWRHISHQKAELSDVDLDSQRNRRSQIIEAIKKRKGERRVLNCCTFKKEGSRSAILTAARGLGVDNDIAQYIAGLIPITRGFTWSIDDCLYGNEEEERKPITEFSNEISNIPQLLDTAKKIEGLVNGRSIHASAVYIFNGDFIEHNARMKAPNGVYVTQYNMKDSDYQSGLKMDLLTISTLDEIRYCMDMLVASGHMEWQGSLRGTYNKYLHPDVLDYTTPEMWDWVSENKVMDLFQFNTQVGLQAAKRIKPHSIRELAAANSIMRLMVTESGAEQPIDTYIRYKNDINQWYDCMIDLYQLTKKEIEVLEPYLLPEYGVGATQEDVMELSMDPHIANFTVAESNKLRKGIAKYFFGVFYRNIRNYEWAKSVETKGMTNKLQQKEVILVDGAKLITEKEKEKIRTLALNGVPCKDIASEIGRHYSSVKRFLNKEELPSNPKKYGIPLEFYSQIENLYKSGLSSEEIYADYLPQFTSDQIGYVVRTLGISRPNGKIVKMNHNYFSIIDSKRKAYWLGLLTADGTVSFFPNKGKCYRITLELKVSEKYLIDEFAKDIGLPPERVKVYTNPKGFQRKDGSPHTTARITFHSKQIFMDLGNLEVIPLKSLYLDHIPALSNEYIPHYLRGFFDGNGSITHNISSSGQIRPELFFYSTHSFCESINNTLTEQLSFSDKNVYDQKNEKISMLAYTKKEELKIIYNFFYENADIYHKGKEIKFKSYLSQYRDNYEIKTS